MAFSQGETGLCTVVGSDFNLFLRAQEEGSGASETSLLRVGGRRGDHVMPLRAVACTPSPVTFVPISGHKANLMTKPGVSEVEKLVPTTRKHGQGQGREGRLKSPTAT